MSGYACSRGILLCPWHLATSLLVIWQNSSVCTMVVGWGYVEVERETEFTWPWVSLAVCMKL